jgi:hypothetical protein
VGIDAHVQDRPIDNYGVQVRLLLKQSVKSETHTQMLGLQERRLIAFLLAVYDYAVEIGGER